MVPGVTRDRHMRSRCRCSMCPAIHTNSRSWLRSSSTHEPSDPPLRVVSLVLLATLVQATLDATRAETVPPRRLPSPEIRYRKTVSRNRNCRGGRAGQPAPRGDRPSLMMEDPSTGPAKLPSWQGKAEAASQRLFEPLPVGEG